MQIRPFRFDRAFPCDKPPVGDELLGDLLAEVQRLRDELARGKEAAEDQARETGNAAFDAGLNQGREEAGGALLSAVDALHAAIDELDERFDERVRTLAREAAAATLAAADLLAGHELACRPERAIDDAIGDVLGRVARGTEIAVRVHPVLVEPLTARLAARQAMDRRRLAVTILPDATLALGDARLTWTDGGVTLDRAARRGTMMEELRPLLSPAFAERATEAE